MSLRRSLPMRARAFLKRACHMGASCACVPYASNCVLPLCAFRKLHCMGNPRMEGPCLCWPFELSAGPPKPQILRLAACYIQATTVLQMQQNML
eukprot:354879-Chlamydomonas_euryale.AAC.3